MSENLLPTFEEFKKGKINEDYSDFAKELENSVKSVFPDSYVQVRPSKDSVTLFFRLGKDKTEWKNGIEENDVAIHNIHYFIQRDNTFSAESNYGSISVKPPVGSHYAYGRVRTGWRNFKADQANCVRKTTDYFKKLKNIIKDNISNMVDYDADIAKKKI